MPETANQIDRRRFLVMVGGIGGVIGAASLVGWRALMVPSGARTLVEPSGATVFLEVEPGFVSAAGWRGDLLTLRPGNVGGGMLLREELSGKEYAVDAPGGFIGRCVTVSGGEVVIAGHRTIETGQLTFEAGDSYLDLISDAGPAATLLKSQPGIPEVAAHTHVFVERYPALVSSTELSEWSHSDLVPRDGTGGSFGAALGRANRLLVESYVIAEVPDSVNSVRQIDRGAAINGNMSAVGVTIPIDHGSLWGNADDGNDDLIITVDRNGIVGRNRAGEPAFSIDDGSALQGVEPTESGLGVTVATASGNREQRLFRDSKLQSVEIYDDALPVRHRIAKDITIVSTNGPRRSPLSAAAPAALEPEGLTDSPRNSPMQHVQPSTSDDSKVCIWS